MYATTDKKAFQSNKNRRIVNRFECVVDVVRGGGGCGPVYRDKSTPPKKGGESSFTVTKLPSIKILCFFFM